MGDSAEVAKLERRIVVFKRRQAIEQIASHSGPFIHPLTVHATDARHTLLACKNYKDTAFCLWLRDRISTQLPVATLEFAVSPSPQSAVE
jgi:hypothetical protein